MIIKTDEDFINNYTTDASNFKGKVKKVIIPETITELKKAVRICYKAKEPITISGGGTGLTGGRVPIDGTVISTEKLNRIIEINPVSKYAIVEPGVLLADFQNALNEINCFFPPNPTENNSTIGGNVSTNASGSRTFKYGSYRNFVLGLKILLPDGKELILKRGNSPVEVTDLLLPFTSGERILIMIPEFYVPTKKNASGYYLRSNMDAVDLFIGSEGTLGIITGIKLKFLEKPESVLGLVCFFDDTNRMLDFVDILRKNSKNESLNQLEYENSISPRLIEYFDENSLRILKNKYGQIPSNAKSAIWIEQECANEELDTLTERWYSLIQEFSNLSSQTWVAINDAEHEKIRKFRHDLPLTINEITSSNHQTKIATDTAVPDNHFNEYFHFLQEICSQSNLEYVTFGHIGDFHVHVNFFVKSEEEQSKALRINDEIIAKTLEIKGTVSAEHGIGKIKKRYLHQMYGKEGIDVMKSIKKQLDPYNLLGIGNLFD